MVYKAYEDEDFYIEVSKKKQYPGLSWSEPYVTIKVEVISPIIGSVWPFFPMTCWRNDIYAPPQKGKLYTKLFGEQSTWDELVSEVESNYVKALIKRIEEIREPFKTKFAMFYVEDEKDTQ